MTNWSLLTTLIFDASVTRNGLGGCPQARLRSGWILPACGRSRVSCGAKRRWRRGRVGGAGPGLAFYSFLRTRYANAITTMTSMTANAAISVMRLRGNSVMVATAARARSVKFSSCFGAQVAGLRSTGRRSCWDSTDMSARSLSWLASGFGSWGGVAGACTGLVGGTEGGAGDGGGDNRGALFPVERARRVGDSAGYDQHDISLRRRCVLGSEVDWRHSRSHAHARPF